MRRRLVASASGAAVRWRRAAASHGARRALATAPEPDQDALLDSISRIPPERVRNFSIISHVDHGKSTLADRLMEMTGAVPRARAQAQLLDSLEVERERGITIKAMTVSLLHTRADDPSGEPYLLNLIDTPGHVDFSYEVSRSLAACQGALLLVDATKGVQAQTVANFFLAFEQDLAIAPVLNKIDLPHADVDGALEQLVSAFDLDVRGSCPPLLISAKTGAGVAELLDSLVERLPPPAALADAPLRLLLFDSWYDDFRGVLCLVEVLGGVLTAGSPVLSHASGKTYSVNTIELMRPLGPRALDALGPGQVGCVSLGMKAIDEACVGDTLSSPSAPQPALPGFKRPQPMVFAGFYPLEEAGFDALRHAMERFVLKDGSVSVEHEHSKSLGRGLRCGFLGMLHMEVVQQRLLREHNLDVLVTAPTVPLRATLTDGTELEVRSADALPPPRERASLCEPLVDVTLLTPAEHVGALLRLCEEGEGMQMEQSYLGSDRVLLRYRMPLAEVVVDFHDAVKSASSGYASVDYEHSGEQPADVVHLRLLVNKEPVDALTRIVRRSKAMALAREMVATMSTEIDRQVVDVAIQAVVDGKVVARETVRAFRKNVLAKCYGGDVTRKKKLLEKQKAGKRRAALVVGEISIPQKAFVAVLAPGKRKGRKRGGS